MVSLSNLLGTLGPTCSCALQAVSLRGFSLKEFLSMLLSSDHARTVWVEKARVFLQPLQADDGFLDFCMVQ